MKQVVRINPLDGSLRQAGDQVTFVLPLGTYDLSTLRLWFLASMTGTAGQQSLPRDVETLIETLEVYVGQVKVQHTSYYNQIARILFDFDREVNEVSQRSYLGNSLWINSGLGNTTLNTVNALPCCMSKWVGFLGCGEVIDTSFTGPIRIVITLAPNQVLLANITNAAYRLSDLHMTLETVSDSTPKSVGFDSYKSFLQGNASYSQQTQMSLSARHIDYLIATYLPPDYRSRAIANTTTDCGTSYFFAHGSGTGTLPSTTWNFKINGQNCIQYQPSLFQATEFMNDLFPDSGSIASPLNTTKTGTSVILGQSALNKYLWATGLRLDLDAADGVDLMSNFSLLVAKCDSLLRYDPKTKSYIFEA
ncbi:hypothetical protein TSOC_004217 [Tetrabaena socialis]|uniref:Capsid protein n=1 Tax=Tetrabaena socialis TaxID=47790 RepID=A0A2J8A9F7_9CHLO|nr:hypothetical protein TSOC_004217 [Tetrabaena socialis]|eukprot:PNH09168.1 hypothetical protein TSOC_004217 [Tetrabaena socialis]